MLSRYQTKHLLFSSYLITPRIFERGNKNDHIVGFIKVKHLFDQDECHIQIESIAHRKTISAITYPTWKFHKQMADLSNES